MPPAWDGRAAQRVGVHCPGTAPTSAARPSTRRRRGPSRIQAAGPRATKTPGQARRPLPEVRRGSRGARATSRAQSRRRAVAIAGVWRASTASPSRPWEARSAASRSAAGACTESAAWRSARGARPGLTRTCPHVPLGGRSGRPARPAQNRAPQPRGHIGGVLAGPADALDPAVGQGERRYALGRGSWPKPRAPWSRRMRSTAALARGLRSGSWHFQRVRKQPTQVGRGAESVSSAAASRPGCATAPRGLHLRIGVPVSSVTRPPLAYAARRHAERWRCAVSPCGVRLVAREVGLPGSGGTGASDSSVPRQTSPRRGGACPGPWRGARGGLGATARSAPPRSGDCVRPGHHHRPPGRSATSRC